MATLLQLVEALVSDPEAKADYGRDPDRFLEQRGFGDLDSDDVTEALGQAADSFPPAFASQLLPADGLAALTSIDLEDLGMSGVEDYSSSSTTPMDNGLFSDWDDDGVSEWSSSPDITHWELEPPTTAAEAVLEPAQDIDDDLQFAPNEPSHVSPTSHLFADPDELDTPLAVETVEASAPVPDVATDVAIPEDIETDNAVPATAEESFGGVDVYPEAVVEDEAPLIEVQPFDSGAFSLPADDPWVPSVSETDDSFDDNETSDWDDDVDGNVMGNAFGH